jgi:hypothetical protein
MSTIAMPAPASVLTMADRRRSVRLDVLDHLNGQVVMFNVPVRCRDIGAGGVATESAMSFVVGSRHLLRLTTPSGVEIVIAATVTHQRPVASPTGLSQFVTGFAFVTDRDPKTAHDVERLLGALQAEAVG